MEYSKLTDSELLRLIQERYDYSKRKRRSYEDQWTSNYKRYMSILEPTMLERYKWRSKLFIPASYKAVEGITPRLILSLFPNINFFGVEPREEQDVQSAQILQSLIAYQFTKCAFFDQMSQFVKQMVLYGTSIAKIYWKREVIVKTKKGPNIFGFQLPSTQEEVVKFDGPTFEPVDILDFYNDPDYKDLSSWHMHKTKIKLSDLKATGVYKNLDLVEIKSALDSEAENKKQERKYVRGETTDNAPVQERDPWVSIIEYYTEKKDRIITMANESFIIRNIENPFNHCDTPFVACQYLAAPFDFYGRGIPELVRDLQDQLNDITNQRLDNVNLIINRMWKIVRGYGVDLNRLVSRPGGILLCDEGGAVEPIDTPDVTQSAYIEAQNAELKIEEVTGATKYTVGVGQDASRKTATEAKIQTMAGDDKFILIVQQIQSQVVEPTIRRFYQLSQQFLNSEMVVRIIGPEGAQFQTVSQSDIIGDFDFIPGGSMKTSSQDLIRSQLINFYGMTIQDPTVNHKELLRRIWESMGFKDVNTIVAPDEMVQQQMMMQGQGVPGQMMESPQGELPLVNPPTREATPEEAPAGGMDQVAAAMQMQGI